MGLFNWLSGTTNTSAFICTLLRTNQCCIPFFLPGPKMSLSGHCCRYCNGCHELEAVMFCATVFQSFDEPGWHE
jgi:hypothetical protein